MSSQPHLPLRAAILETLESRQLLSAYPIFLGGGGTDLASSVAIDKANNIYYAGTFSGTVDFDPSGATQNLTASGVASTFVAKFSPAGALIWAKRIGGIGSTSHVYDGTIERFARLALDGSNNVYITGSFSGTRDFDPGTGTKNLTGAGQTDAFICKLNSSGQYVWAKRFGGTSHDHVSGIAVAANGYIYTTGYFRGTADFDPSASAYRLTSADSDADIFVARYSPTGAFSWARRIGASDDDQPFNLALDTNGNPHICGYFSAQPDFDPGSGVYKLTNKGEVDAFVLKLTTTGGFVWARAFGGAGIDAATALDVDQYKNVYITGAFARTVDFNPGSATNNLTSAGNWDTFVTKLNSSGNYVNAKRIGGPGNDVSWSLDVRGSALLLSGSFQGSVDFNPSSSVYKLTSGGGDDAFFCKLNTTLAFSWARRIGQAQDEWGIALAVNSSGYVYGAGLAAADASVDDDSGVEIDSGGNIGLIKYNSSGALA